MKQIIFSAFMAAFVVLVSIGMLPGAASAQYQISFSVFGNGGAAVAGSGYIINGTAGQPDDGVTGNSSDVNDVGFWYIQSEAVTGIHSHIEVIPKRFQLDQNYPNPFNPTTEIRYQISEVSKVSLKVYDILGREVATLVNQKENPGSYSVTFDASRLASGVYFYRLAAGSFVKVKKLMLVK